MPIPKKGSIPGRKQPIGLSDLLGGAENLLGNLLAEILGKTIKEVQNLNLEDLLKLAEAQGNKEALKKLNDLVAKHGIVQFGARGRILGKEFGGDLPLDRRTPAEKFTVKYHEPKVQTIKKKSKSEEEMRQPNLDVFDEKDSILVIGDMPGVNEEDIKYELKEKTLRIYTETGRKYEKEIELPAPVTKKVDLNYKNGVLEMKLIKKVN